MKLNWIRIAVAACCFGIILISSLEGASANMIYTPAPLSLIEIQEDGTINPSTAPLTKNGNYYTLTANINNQKIEINCSNIVFDGAGLFVVGDGVANAGITIKFCTPNVTITNVQIQKYYIGIEVQSSNNTISKNVVCHCVRGINLWDSYNNITDNLIGFNGITGSIEGGRCGFNIEAPFNYFRNNTLIKQRDISLFSSNNTFIENNFFIEYVATLSSQSESLQSNLFEGNYWTNYNGTDENEDGVGDSPHVVVTRAGSFQDSAPLMYPKNLSPNLLSLLNITVPEPASITPSPTQNAPSDFTPTPSVPEFPFSVILPVLLISTLAAGLILRKSKENKYTR